MAAGKSSRVNRKYKTKYKIRNCREYERGLKSRGDVTTWLSEEAIAAWTPPKNGLRGGQRRYSNLAILTALTLRVVFSLPLRQSEGFLDSLLSLMGLDLKAPDHTTLSRRNRIVEVPPLTRAHDGPIHLIVDSTGLEILGCGEWNAHKYKASKKRRDWSIYERVGAAGTRDVVIVIPPRRCAVLEGPTDGPWAQREAALQRIRKIGRREWQKESGYRQQARVENGFFRYKSVLGGKLQARNSDAQMREAMIGCHILNRMAELSRPKSYAVVS